MPNITLRSKEDLISEIDRIDGKMLYHYGAALKLKEKLVNLIELYGTVELTDNVQWKN